MLQAGLGSVAAVTTWADELARSKQCHGNMLRTSCEATNTCWPLPEACQSTVIQSKRSQLSP